MCNLFYFFFKVIYSKNTIQETETISQPSSWSKLDIIKEHRENNQQEFMFQMMSIIAAPDMNRIHEILWAGEQ